MNTSHMRQLQGLSDLVHDAVKSCTAEVETVYRAFAGPPFAILGRIPGIAPGAGAVEWAHDRVAGLTFLSIRAINSLVNITARELIAHVPDRRDSNL